MASNSNKLVDKYQYNDSQITTDGFAQLITAKHIVLRQLFTLKKISINNPKAAAKYHGIVNEMNILKYLGDQPFLFKCHKMLKTSNNLYLVYDLIGRYPSLAQMIEKNTINGQAKKKQIALQILRYLKQLKKHSIVFLDLNPRLVQVTQNSKVKFLNLENAIFLNKNTSSLSFLNILISQNLAPQLKQFIQTCSVPYEKQIQFQIFQDKIHKADLFSYGKLLQKLFDQQFSFIQTQSSKKIDYEENFQSAIKKIVQKLLSAYPNQRPTYDQIESLLSDNKNESNEDLKNPQIKISRLDRNMLAVSTVDTPVLKKSKSTMKASKINQPQKINLLSIPTGEDSFDTRSIRSSGNYTDSKSPTRSRQRRNSFSNLIESESSNDQAFKAFVLKVLTRRNLCKFLLNLSKLIFQLNLIDYNLRTMLSFLLLKKSVLLTCSLARFVSTGKGDGQQLSIKDSVRKQFSKTNDFFLLSVLIDKQMDNSKNLYQATVTKLIDEFPELKNNKQFNFDYECISENVNEKLMKQLVKKSVLQILKKLENSGKPQTNKRSQRNLLNPTDGLWTSVRYSQRKNSDYDQITSVRSAKTTKTTISGDPNNSQINSQNYQSENILRNISQENLIQIYLMGLILDFQSYQKMFAKLIEDSNIKFQQQSLLKELKKMGPKQIVLKLHKVVD